MSFDLIRAIKRPFTDLNKLGIGVLLLMIPYLNIITSFFVKGYRLEVARTASGKKLDMPRWENFWSLFLKGLLSWIIGIIYILPGIILILISAGNIIYQIIQSGLNQGAILGNSLTNQLLQNSLLQNTSMIPVFIIGVLITLLGAYLTPLAIVRYSEKYKFKSSFDLGLVFKKAFTGKYFLAMLASGVYTVVVSLIVITISLGYATLNIQYLTMALNMILGGLSSFMVIVTSYTIFGEVYTKLK